VVRRVTERIASVMLQDQKGALITFKDFFQGQPSIVVFFYTRCDNPMKCSLTIAKLARVQKILEAQGFPNTHRSDYLRSGVTSPNVFASMDKIEAFEWTPVIEC
jgi:hypothetical protein